MQYWISCPISEANYGSVITVFFLLSNMPIGNSNIYRHNEFD